MNHIAALANPLRLLFENLTSVFRAPPRIQIAAFCYRHTADQSEVLLITSRQQKRWIMPKGWPMAHRTARKCAEREAYEQIWRERNDLAAPRPGPLPAPEPESDVRLNFVELPESLRGN